MWFFLNDVSINFLVLTIVWMNVRIKHLMFALTLIPIDANDLITNYLQQTRVYTFHSLSICCGPLELTRLASQIVWSKFRSKPNYYRSADALHLHNISKHRVASTTVWMLLLLSHILSHELSQIVIPSSRTLRLFASMTASTNTCQPFLQSISGSVININQSKHEIII